MADISSIKVGNTTYTLKDADAVTKSVLLPSLPLDVPYGGFGVSEVKDRPYGAYLSLLYKDIQWTQIWSGTISSGGTGNETGGSITIADATKGTGIWKHCGSYGLYAVKMWAIRPEVDGLILLGSSTAWCSANAGPRNPALPTNPARHEVHFFGASTTSTSTFNRAAMMYITPTTITFNRGFMWNNSASATDLGVFNIQNIYVGW